MNTFRVYYKTPSGMWVKVPFATGTLQYCNGYVDAMDSLYPSRPHRIVKESPRTSKIVRETPGRGTPHTN